MRNLILISLNLLLAVPAFTQESSKQKAGYVEILGNGIVLSANYEQQLTKTPAVAVHLGIGLGGYGPAIPMGIKYLRNIGNQRSFFETGIGLTLAERGVWEYEFQNEPGSKKYYPALVPSVGYRYHARSGFMCRINYTPVFTNWEDKLLFFGLSTGWRF